MKMRRSSLRSWIFIRLSKSQALRDRLSAEAKAQVGEEFFTVHNWANWAYIWLKVKQQTVKRVW